MSAAIPSIVFGSVMNTAIYLLTSLLALLLVGLAKANLLTSESGQLALLAVLAAVGALLAFGLHRLHGANNAVATMNLSAKSDVDEAAANLFGYLRALDAKGAQAIAVMPIPEHGLGLAINDRLRRAAAPRGASSAAPAPPPPTS